MMSHDEEIKKVVGMTPDDIKVKTLECIRTAKDMNRLHISAIIELMDVYKKVFDQVPITEEAHRLITSGKITRALTHDAIAIAALVQAFDDMRHGMSVVQALFEAKMPWAAKVQLGKVLEASVEKPDGTTA